MGVKIKNNCLLLESGVDVPEELPKLEAQTIVPSTEDQIIPAGYYLAGDQTILGDPNLIPENIRAGETIFGVTGTYEGETGGDDPETEGDYNGTFTISDNYETREVRLYADADIENCTISNLLVKSIDEGTPLHGQITEIRDVVFTYTHEGTATVTVYNELDDVYETVEATVERTHYINARYDTIRIIVEDDSVYFYGDYTWQFDATNDD